MMKVMHVRRATSKVFLAAAHPIFTKNSPRVSVRYFTVQPPTTQEKEDKKQRIPIEEVPSLKDFLKTAAQ